ncbi:type III secretion apparatus assembly protein SctX [Chitinimonas lacunae]|uniref:Uncharacterized protein n=1 Tax=Chitinimonas lacunae TaxID=1963018 RepID=A0ABV8MQX3_9NEIS
MDDLRYQGFNFDRGIERIVPADDLPPGGLPSGSELPPAELPTQARLDQLLAMPRLDDLLDAVLRPEFNQREILAPARFRQVLEGTVSTLRQLADSEPHLARPLSRAARQLQEEAALRDLLQMYRSALYQG